jgi:hypothetical protein
LKFNVNLCKSHFGISFVGKTSQDPGEMAKYAEKSVRVQGKMRLPKIRVRMDVLEMVALQYEPSLGNWHISTVREMLNGNFTAYMREVKDCWICMGIFDDRKQAEEALKELRQEKH